jgi:pimeloyl-ACP methyl ester carboxylesterase
MNYDTARNHEIHDAHQRAIDIFAKTYLNDRPTIVLLPGGMGSHLDRSTRPFKNDQSIPFGLYDPVWMDLEMIFGRDLELLAMGENGHDFGEHIIIPTGPLQFLVNAYDGTKRFFTDLGWNYIVFGYDWRRSLEEAASQLTEFLVNLRDRVKDLRDRDPLPTTTLIAHSQGGLVGKIFLQSVSGDDGRGAGNWLERFVSIGTPFYGASSHQDRYYQGQSPLNTFYGKRRVAEIAGSMPGPYVLMFADQAALDADAQAKLGLNGYPITDATTGAPADPYDSANFDRYPSWVRRSALEAALLARETIAFPLPDPAAERVFHIRSGLNAATISELKWQPVVGASYDPANAASPLTGTAGRGDGTVPFWAARLAQTPDAQIYDLEQASDHGGLAEHAETLTVIRKLVEKGKLPTRAAVASATAALPAATLGTPKASAAKTNKFVNDALSGELKKHDDRASDPEVWRRLLEETQLC